MNIRTAIRELEASKIFNDFLRDNPKYYLSMVFVNISDGEEDMQVGYYDKKSDTIVTFNNDPVEQNPPDKVFKKERYMKKLNMEKVRISLNDARRAVDELLKKDYSAEVITKTLIILQNLEKQIYNFTLITRSLSIINIHVNAESGKIESSAKKPIMSLAK